MAPSAARISKPTENEGIPYPARSQADTPQALQNRTIETNSVVSIENGIRVLIHKASEFSRCFAYVVSNHNHMDTRRVQSVSFDIKYIPVH
jgi:hypothetical protein